jgi:hypothetical protein
MCNFGAAQGCQKFGSGMKVVIDPLISNILLIDMQFECYLPQFASLA